VGAITDDFSALIAEADTAMYRIKHNRRVAPITVTRAATERAG
jgi:PleD family two-component response regulator